MHGTNKRWVACILLGTELVANCSLLLLDEPTSGLDATVAEDCMKVIKRIASRGILLYVLYILLYIFDQLYSVKYVFCLPVMCRYWYCFSRTSTTPRDLEHV